MKTLQITLLPIFLLALSSTSYGQDSTRRQADADLEIQRQKQQQHYYGRVLNLDSLQARQVSAVLEDYKASLKQITTDSRLVENFRREKIDSIRALKNQKLMLLLNPEQQRKIIPVSERHTMQKSK